MLDLNTRIETVLNRLGFGMRGKLILLFVIIKVVPLFLLALMAWWQFEHLGDELRVRTEVLADKAKKALTKTGAIAVSDAISALDRLAQEDIERMTTDVAMKVADFLYARDANIRYVATLPQDIQLYDDFLQTTVGRLVRQNEWVLAPDKQSWVPAKPAPEAPRQTSSNKENELNFNYRPPIELDYIERPLFLELTFVDLNGQEQIKAITSPRVSPECRDISRRENTYAKAESYFEELKKLKPGEIYVSDVIGTYVPSKVIGIFTPENAAKAKIPFEPEKAAFAGQENPVGKRFEGIVRWATPVVRDEKIIGYVTLALNHDHLMTFVDHVTPAKERYGELSDAYDGNYAFIWDYKGRSIAHPRHHSITGFHPETGKPQTPWLEETIYERWKSSGQPIGDFLADEPTFVEQSVHKRPAAELTQEGLVGLDCRYLNFAPQCTGWFDLTSQGGSGSFNILWSGLRKLTTAATIPYFTGHYANSPRGFGFVAVGAGLEDFHRPATETGKELTELITATDAELKKTVKDTRDLIRSNLADTALSLSLSTAFMILLVVLIAVWMASVFTGSITAIITGISRFRSGERQFRFKAKVKDELGVLCDSFDSMADSIEKSVQGLLLITDIHQKVLYANKAFLDTIGRQLADVVGQPYAAISIFTRQNPLASLLNGHECEVEFHEATGCYYKGMAEEYKNEHGQTIGYVITATDVTSMVLAQQKSEEEHGLLDIIFSSSPDMMWYKNTVGTYLAVNPRFASMYGKRPEDIVGLNAQHFLPADKLREEQHFDSLALEQKAPLRTEEEIGGEDSQMEVIEAVRTPIFNSAHELVGLLGVARDITERTHFAEALRKTQHDLEKAAEAAQQASAAKGQFLANMSHEIRTPMNAILGFSYIALQDDLPREQRDMFQKIHSAATGLLGIINDILDFSKIEARKLDLILAPFSLREHVCIVHDMIDLRAKEKGIDLSVFFAPDLLGADELVGDAARLRQVLLNLLGNAVKFTDKGGVILELDILERQEKVITLRCSVHDTGIGIRHAEQETLFLPFSQADGSVTRRYGGTGLGLAICKDLVHLMDGSISVESEPGWGSIFAISLPLALAETQPEKVAPAAPSPHDLLKLKGKRVLLVEDNEINQQIAANILEQVGIKVSLADNGENAVNAVSKRAYDLVLMDIQMPVMDGLEATRRIRALSGLGKNVPIVAMTAHAMSDDQDKSLAAGMNAHITKPIDPDVVFRELIRWMT